MGKASRNKAAKQQRRAARKQKAAAQQKQEQPMSARQIAKAEAMLGWEREQLREQADRLYAKRHMHYVPSPQQAAASQPKKSNSSLFDLRFKPLPVRSIVDYHEKILVWEGTLQPRSSLFEKISVFLTPDAIPTKPEADEENYQMVALGEHLAYVALVQTQENETLEEFQENQQKTPYGAFNDFYIFALYLAQEKSVALAERIMWSRVELTLKNGDVIYYDPEEEYWAQNMVWMFNDDFNYFRQKIQLAI